MIDASKHYVKLVEELHKKAGERIAELFRCRSQPVLLQGRLQDCHSATAAMTRGNKARALQLPDTAGMRDEVIILKCHRTLYDQALPMTG